MSTLAQKILKVLAQSNDMDYIFQPIKNLGWKFTSGRLNDCCYNFLKNVRPWDMWFLDPEKKSCNAKPCFVRLLLYTKVEFKKKQCIDCSKMKENDKWQFTTFSGQFFGNYMTIFHKTEVQTIILRCLTGLNLGWFKSYDSKCKYFHFRFFVIL